MKACYKYLSMIAIAVCLFSCSDELLPESKNSVKVNAVISADLVTRVSDDGTSFTDGDVITVINMNSDVYKEVRYTYSASSGVWGANDKLSWAGRENNEFQAWYPYNSGFSTFAIRLDQSQGNSAADWMTASKVAKQSDGTVNFEFTHHLSKITISIAGWGEEFTAAERAVDHVDIFTVSSNLNKTGDRIVGGPYTEWVHSYANNGKYQAIVAPGYYYSGYEVAHIYLEGRSEPLVVKTDSDISLLSGKAYRFNVTIGRDVIILNESDVTVLRWIDEQLDDQELTQDVSQTPDQDITAYNDISQNGTANSYIVSRSGLYKFTPTKGNSNESVGTIDSAEVLWETFGTDETPAKGDLVKNVKYENGVISFETPSAYKEGNAVIAAKDANGTILWSWHIWLTDQPEEQMYYNDAGTMMDRNLGATSATPGDAESLGLIYQWGRKDPFLGSSSITKAVVAASTMTWSAPVVSNATTGTIEYVVSNPTTYVTENGHNSDWYYSGSADTDNTRWNLSKSIYDPCPEGWCVPPRADNGVWSSASGLDYELWSEGYSSGNYHYKYDKSNKGINFSGLFGDDLIIWYPLSASRRDSDGSLYLGGGYWTCPGWTNSPWANPMQIDMYRTVLGTGHSRAIGYSVRCMKMGEDSPNGATLPGFENEDWN